MFNYERSDRSILKLLQIYYLEKQNCSIYIISLTILLNIYLLNILMNVEDFF